MDINNGEKKDKILIWPNVFAVDGDSLWIVYGLVPALFKYDLNTKQLDFVSQIPCESKENLFSAMIIDNGNLYMIPGWSVDLIVYHINENKYDKIAVDKIDKYSFAGAYKVGRRIVCIPSYLSDIAILNMDDLTWDYIKNVKDSVGFGDVDYFFESAIDKELHLIYFVSPQTNYVGIYDYQNNKLKTTMVSEIKGGSYIVVNNSNIIICDNSTKKTVVLDKSFKYIKDVHMPKDNTCYKIMKWNSDKMILDEVYGNYVGIYDLNHDETEKVDHNKILEHSSFYGRSMLGKATYFSQGCLYYNRADATYMMLKDDKILRFQIEFDEKQWDVIKMIIIKHSGHNSVAENDMLSLSDMIDYLGRYDK